MYFPSEFLYWILGTEGEKEDDFFRNVGHFSQTLFLEIHSELHGCWKWQAERGLQTHSVHSAAHVTQILT